jgi:hypothetical protein
MIRGDDTILEQDKTPILNQLRPWADPRPNYRRHNYSHARWLYRNTFILVIVGLQILYFLVWLRKTIWDWIVFGVIPCPVSAGSLNVLDAGLALR